MTRVNDFFWRKQSGHFNKKHFDFFKDTNVIMNSVMRQKEFLTSMLHKLKWKISSRRILVDLYHLRSILVTTPNIALHITADLNELNKMKTDLNLVWQRFKVPYFARGPKKYLIFF